MLVLRATCGVEYPWSAARHPSSHFSRRILRGGQVRLEGMGLNYAYTAHFDPRFSHRGSGRVTLGVIPRAQFHPQTRSRHAPRGSGRHFRWESRARNPPDPRAVLIKVEIRFFFILDFVPRF